MENIDLIQQGKDIVEKLSIVRDDYIATKTELKLSIRKDIVSAELKEILSANPDFYSLRNALEEYINSLIAIEKGDTNATNW